MNTLLTASALFTLTLTTVAVYPSIKTIRTPTTPPIDQAVQMQDAPVIDVVFVLDTTGSMGGLIQTAKEKIWSIATTMTAAQQTPSIRIGLVGYRDQGDTYITRVVDLNDDLDSVYSELMDFEADGGGDGPEDVNRALFDAVHTMSWSQDTNAYQTIFLVGDAPPHMDYHQQSKYPEIVAAAVKRGIVVNTIQCGNDRSTIHPWTRISELGGGRYFSVDQAGGALAVKTPYDQEIANLSAKLDGTRFYYGSREEKEKMQTKVDATAKLNEEASVESRARRGAFNASQGGKKNRIGKHELVNAVVSGDVELDDIDVESLPQPLQSMVPEARLKTIKDAAEKRDDLARQIRLLSAQRDEFIAKKVEERGDANTSLDHQVYQAVKEQGADSGLTYENGPKY